MNITAASNREALSATACGGFEGALMRASRLWFAPSEKSDALGSVILLSIVVFRELNG